MPPNSQRTNHNCQQAIAERTTEMSELTHTPSTTTERVLTVAPPAPLLVTVRQACHMLGLGRTSIYHLVRTGQLKPVRIGSAVRFSVDHLREFVNAQATK